MYDKLYMFIYFSDLDFFLITRDTSLCLLLFFVHVIQILSVVWDFLAQKLVFKTHKTIYLPIFMLMVKIY